MECINFNSEFYEDTRSLTKVFLSLHSGKVRIWFQVFGKLLDQKPTKLVTSLHVISNVTLF